MLLSNWDTKDRRDVAQEDSNTAISITRSPDSGPKRAISSSNMGRGDGEVGGTVSRAPVDVDGFEAQTPGFVAAFTMASVDFGYRDSERLEILPCIPVSHVLVVLQTCSPDYRIGASRGTLRCQRRHRPRAIASPARLRQGSQALHRDAVAWAKVERSARTKADVHDKDRMKTTGARPRRRSRD
jgi:hypothetical protein